MCKHLVVRQPVRSSIPDAYFDAAVGQDPESWTAVWGHPIPMFAFYGDSCPRPYNNSTKLAEQQVAWLQRDDTPPAGVMSFLHDTPVSHTSWTEGYLQRAEKWCDEACAGVRTLDVIGVAPLAYSRISPNMRYLKTLRRFPYHVNSRYRDLCRSSIPIHPHFFAGVSFSLDGPGGHLRFDPYELKNDAQKVTLAVQLLGFHHHKLNFIKLAPPHPGTRDASDLTILLCPSKVISVRKCYLDVLDEPRMFGGALCLAMFHPSNRRWKSNTIVGLTARTASAFGLYDEVGGLTFHDSNALGPEVVGRDVDELFDSALERFIRKRAANDRNLRLLNTGKRAPLGEKDIQREIGRFRRLTWPEWRAEEPDEEWRQWVDPE